jgi:hypothetical protein
MPTVSIAAVLGFAFVVVWATCGLGWALLALLLAGLFALAAAFARGELDLEDLRERAEAARSGFAAPTRRRVG